MSRKWFSKCETVNEVKKRYHELAMIHHPDKGGDVETMKEINAEYLEALEFMDGETITGTDGKQHKYYYNQENEKTVIDKINELLNLHMEDVKIELIGSWIWIAGNTKDYRKELKTAGCRWHSKRRIWYFHRGRKYHRNSTLSMEDLRRVYGRKEWTEEDKRREVAGGQI